MKARFFLLSAAALLTSSAALAQGSNVTFGGGASGNATSAAPASSSNANKENDEWAERDRKMNEAATITGGVGLVHTQHAQGGAAGQIRVGFTTEYMSAGFLCSTEFPCRDPRNPSQ